MTGQDIRVGVIGFGYASKTFHVPLLRTTPGYKISAVSTSRPIEVAAALLDVDLIAEPAAVTSHPDVDLVVIASPNDSHVPLARAALLAGKHVVVDKPFTITTSEARQLAALADEKQRVLSVFHNRRWDSDFLTVRAAIAENVVGRITLFESRIDRFRPQVRDRWRENVGPGAGLLYDLGPHLIDEALVLFGPPHSVQATLEKQRTGAQTDDYFHLVLRYDALVVVLQAGMLVAGGSARFAMHGDRASLIKYKPDIQEEQLRAGLLPGAPGWGVDPDDAIVFDGTDPRRFKAKDGDQRGYYMALRDALRDGAPVPVTATQGAAVMAIIEAAITSDAEGRRIVPDLTDNERAAWR